MARLYTRTGDSGETFCPLNRKRVPKHDLCIELLGVLDEAQSLLGLAAEELRRAGLNELASLAQRVQELLFRLGLFLVGRRECITASDIEWVEKAIDTLWEGKRLEGFVLHGGHPASAVLGVARAAVRRLERALTACYERGLCSDGREIVVPLVNRLSDLLFAAELDAAERLGKGLPRAPSC